MQPDRELHATIFNFLREEFDAINSALGSGEIKSFRDKVNLSRKISGVMQALGPLVRSDMQARLLVRRAEHLKRDLLSSRPYTEQRIPAPLLRQIFMPPVHRGRPGP